AELRAEGAEALRLLGTVDRTPVLLPVQLDARVMAEVRRCARSPLRRAWRRLVEPRDVELRLRVRPWVVWGGALAVAATVALLFAWPPPSPGGARPVRMAARDSVFVRFVLYAPGAKRVAVAGTFNQWDQNAAPLVRLGAGGIWTITLALPQGQHQYAFVVDGDRRGARAGRSARRGERCAPLRWLRPPGRGSRGRRGLRARRRAQREAGAAVGAREPPALRAGAHLARGGHARRTRCPPEELPGLGGGPDRRGSLAERPARSSERGPSRGRPRRDAGAGGRRLGARRSACTGQRPAWRRAAGAGERAREPAQALS